MAADDEERTAVDAINTAIEGLPNDVLILMHLCQGNYAVGPDYDGQIGHRYFDQGKWSPSASEGDAWLPTPFMVLQPVFGRSHNCLPTERR